MRSSPGNDNKPGSPSALLCAGERGRRGGLLEAEKVAQGTGEVSCLAALLWCVARPELVAVLFSERQVASDKGEAAGGLQLSAGE